ncbi:transposase [Chroococcidiopsis sp. CCMEE 29]|uniref:RNA-guided endonuclease InsQ/TnpB family protein n=1 Tax=Chroococcidiopsis sp. CCMEE 29 TaxID=155894 RepID=UPI002022449B|nr:transposase [Chroococcidiopsis sp. CCMEE 29]
MEQTLTLVCKLQPTPEQVAKIEATLKAFADACNYANEQVKPQITSKTTIQNMVYQDLRSKFDLSANLAVRACARVGANRKTAKAKGKPVKTFKPTSADYDARIFAFREKDWSASLTLNGGREHIKLKSANYQMGKLKGRCPTSAQLCKHKDGLYYLHIQLTDIAPEPIKSGKVIGVDFGRRDIAVTSSGDKWDGKQIKETRDRFSRVRASLQRKGTKGAKRALKRLSGRERKYQTWLNHTISRAIIADAKAKNAIVAIENLTGIRERTNSKPRNKIERRHSNSWGFYQLRVFLEYKGIQSGVEVIAVPPAYTSQTCHQCLHIGLRSDKVFKCGNCSWHGDADFNAANVISLLGGAFVSLPERSVLACSLSEPQARAKAPRL